MFPRVKLGNLRGSCGFKLARPHEWHNPLNPDILIDWRIENLVFSPVSPDWRLASGHGLRLWIVAACGGCVVAPVGD